MTTTMPTTTRDPHEGRLALREEDLEVGRRFVHPETRLEYEDFHAYFLGKDPLPHWRNAYIKGVWAGKDDAMQAGSAQTAFLPRTEFRAHRIELIVRLYDRDGHPFVAYADDPRICRRL